MIAVAAISHRRSLAALVAAGIAAVCVPALLLLIIVAGPPPAPEAAATPSSEATVLGDRAALETVGGITVAASLAPHLADLLAAAGELPLGGSGVRSAEDQIRLRRAHCGTTDYAIYRQPASECHPPTAVPGQSMHEQGLAIDFTCAGTLVTRRDPCYRWLTDNASSFGLYNLPSEPWHWSVNGR
jgi:hypothetical protein